MYVRNASLFLQKRELKISWNLMDSFHSKKDQSTILIFRYYTVIRRSTASTDRQASSPKTSSNTINTRCTVGATKRRRDRERRGSRGWNLVIDDDAEMRRRRGSAIIGDCRSPPRTLNFRKIVARLRDREKSIDQERERRDTPERSLSPRFNRGASA